MNNGTITIEKIREAIDNLPVTQHDFTVEFYLIFKEESIPMLFKLFQAIKASSSTYL